MIREHTRSLWITLGSSLLPSWPRGTIGTEECADKGGNSLKREGPVQRAWGCKAAVIAAALLLLSGAPLSGQPLEFGLTPPELELVPAPGGTASGVLVVFNKSPRRVRFRVTLADIYIRPSGTIDVLKPASTAWSVAAMSRVQPAEFDLDPDRQIPVRISVTVSADARGGRYGAIIVEPSPVLQTTGVRGTVTVIVPKLAAKLLVPIRGTEIVQGDLVNMLAAARPRGLGADVKIVFRNTGNVHVRTRGELALLDATGRSLGHVALDEAIVLPGSVRELAVAWTRPLDPGTYAVRTTIDFGGSVLLAGEATFVRKP